MANSGKRGNWKHRSGIHACLTLIGFAGHKYLLIYGGCHSNSVVQALSAGWFIEKRKGRLKRMRTDFKQFLIVYENKNRIFQIFIPDSKEI